MSDQTADDYKLFEFHTLENLFQPIQGLTRIKYTSLDASGNYVFLGANSGSVYVFQRFPHLHYVKVLSSKDGAANVICCSPNEEYIAVATSKGIVSIIQHDIPTKCLHVSKDHKGRNVTCLCWNSSGTSLYIGDDKGKVTSINIKLKKTHSIFQASTALIVELKCAICQLDVFNNQLLVSCYTGTLLCNIQKEQYSWIGLKPREGLFGSCFYAEKVIYCARPGSRLWEVDLKGKVLFTHQFKKALAKAQASLISIRFEQLPSSNELLSCLPLSINFSNLYVICERFIITWSGRNLYVFDPASAAIILWCSLECEIKSISVNGSAVFVHFMDGKFKQFQLLPVDSGINKMIHFQNWNVAAGLCVLYKSKILAETQARVQTSHLQNLLNNLREESEFFQEVGEILRTMEKTRPAFELNGNKNGYKVESGIFVVSRPNGNFRKPPTSLPKAKHALAKPEKLIKSSSGSALDNFFTGSHNMGMVTPFINPQLMDPDFAQFGYDAIASIAATVTFDDIKSRYQSGKEKLLATMGQIEDKFKINHVDHAPKLFDVCSAGDIERKKLIALHSIVKQKGKADVSSIPVANFLKVSYDCWNKISVLSDQKEQTSLLDQWVCLLNETVSAERKLSITPTTKIRRSKSLEFLSVQAIPMKRKNSVPVLVNDSEWSVDDFFYWQLLEIEKLKSGFNFNFIDFKLWNMKFDDLFVVSQLASLCFSNGIFGQLNKIASKFSVPKECKDRASSIFIYRYFNFLNPERVKFELDKNLFENTFLSWTSFMKCLQRNPNKTRTELSPLLESFALALRRESENVVSEICGKLAGSFRLVTSRDVFYLDQTAQLNGRLFLRYMDEIHDRQFLRACSDTVVSHNWIKYIFQSTAISDYILQCKCGNPKVGSHRYPWQRNDLILQILRASQVDEISAAVCKKYGFWLGYMLACNKLGMKSQVLSTIIALNDVNILRNPFNAGLLPNSIADWKFVFDMVNNWTDRCKECQEDLIYESYSPLSVENVAEICINYIEPKTCLQMIAELRPPVKLSPHFFRRAIMTFTEKEKQRNNHENRIGHYVWSQFKNYASTELRSKLLNECSKTENASVTQSKNNLKSHWGTSLDIKSLCFKCNLPLVVPLTEQRSTFSGIRLFQCGHTFHLFCIRDQHEKCHLCGMTSQRK